MIFILRRPGTCTGVASLAWGHYQCGSRNDSVDSNLSANPVYSSSVLVDVQSSVYNYCTWQNHSRHLGDEGGLVVEVSLYFDARGQARGQCVRSRNGQFGAVEPLEDGKCEKDC